jgi:tetratricopeptide (TPR) repeat protein
LLRELREVAPIVLSSTNLDPEADDLISLFLRGNRQAVEQQARRAVAESPDDIASVRLLIEILRADKKYTEANTLALRATVSAPDDPDSWMALGESEMDFGEYPSAILHLNKALAIDPLKRDALIVLFVCHQKSNDSEKALEIRSRIEALGGPLLFG